MEMIINDEQLSHAVNDSVLKSLFNHPEMGMFTLKLTGKFLESNKKFCDIVGYTEKELANMFLQDLYYLENQEKVFQRDDILFAKVKEHYSFEKRVVRKDHSIVWVNIILSLTYDFAQRPYQYVGIVQDISNLKRNEEKLYDTNKILESVFNTTSTMIAYLDINFNFVCVNKQYADAGGHSPEFYIGKNHFALYPHHENEIIFKQVIETGEPISFSAKPFEYKEFPELGITYWDWDLIPVKNAYGNITGLIFSLADVTERKRAEDELHRTNEILEKKVRERTIKLQDEIAERKRIEEVLRQSEQRYREVFENTSDGIFLMDIVSRDCFKYSAFNPSMKKMLGLKDTAALQEFIETVLPRDFIGSIDSHYRRCIELGNMLSYEEHFTISMETIYVHTTLIPIKDDGGKVYRILGVCSDVTEYKKMSEKLKLAKEEAEYANNAKSEYIANMSHELRTPLNVILSAIQLFDLYLKDISNAKSDKLFRHLKTMKQNCLRLLRLVNNLIDTTKIDARFYELNMGNYDIVSIVEVIVLSVTDYVKHKGISLQYISNVDKKIMACDIDIIERIMLNLLSNAIKFIDLSGTIQVSLIDRDKDIVISVKDNGVGIPEDKQKTIFERYKQADNLLTRKHEGSGIGLSLVKSFVEMLEGEISVNSQEGLGSEFVVVLPSKINPISSHKIDMSTHNLADYAMIQKITVELSDIYSI
ncbi:MAG: hypothetical protein K0S71_22 [Clostridia bacterium]|jgi:PAS domain S-box-containing protein|nr:hypothetical protein [Clostridia bacterium]